MTNEVIEYSLKMMIPGSGFNPADINEQKLIAAGIADKNNKLDMGLYRVGALGSNLVFANESEDEIQIQPTEIYLQSNDLSRFKIIVSGLASIFPNVTPREAEFNFDIHLKDRSFPEALFDKYAEYDGLTLDIVRFNIESHQVTMHSCSPNCVHLRVTAVKEVNKHFVDFDLSADINLDEIFDTTAEFIIKGLSIEEPLNL